MNEHRVLSSDHALVKRALLDFRVHENGRDWIVRLKGEGRYRSSVFPEFNETGRRILLEFIPASDWMRPNWLKRWLAAVRLPYLLFSFLPLLLVACRYFSEHRTLPWLEFALLSLSVLSVHMSCNLWSDYEDHLRGVDAPEHSGGSGVVQNLWLPAVTLRNAAAVLMVIGAFFGFGLIAILPLPVVGKHLLWLGLVGGLGAASYSGWPFHYKYIGLGEPIVFILSGPIVTLGASLALYRDESHFLFFGLTSLPLAFLAVLRLHSGNMQRTPFDTMAGVFTIARQLGFFWSKLATGFLLFAPFITLGALWTLRVAPNGSLFALMALPYAFWALLPLRAATGPLDPACAELRVQAAQLHFIFGVLYCLGFAGL